MIMSKETYIINKTKNMDDRMIGICRYKDKIYSDEFYSVITNSIDTILKSISPWTNECCLYSYFSWLQEKTLLRSISSGPWLYVAALATLVIPMCAKLAKAPETSSLSP